MNGLRTIAEFAAKGQNGGRTAIRPQPVTEQR